LHFTHASVFTIYNESEFAVFRLLNTTRRPASADRTACRQFQVGLRGDI